MSPILCRETIAVLPCAAVKDRPLPREKMVHLARDGRLLGGSGGQTLAEGAAYAAELGDLVGDLMGLGALDALDVMLASGGACVVRRQASGDLTAISAPAPADVETLHRRLGGRARR